MKESVILVSGRALFGRQGLPVIGHRGGGKFPVHGKDSVQAFSSDECDPAETLAGVVKRHRNPNKQQDLFSTAWMSCPKVRSKGGIQTVSPGLKEVCYSFKFGAHLYIFLYSCMHIYVYLYMSTLCGITISDSGTQQLFEFNQPVFQEIFLRRK